MPKNWKDWLIIFVLGYLAISAIGAALNTTKDPYPWLTEGNRNVERSLERMHEAERDANQP